MRSLQGIIFGHFRHSPTNRFIILASLMTLLLSPSAEAASKKKTKQLTYDCAVTYLRETDALDKHVKHTPKTVNEVDCDDVVEHLRDSFYDAMRPQFDEDADFANHSACIMEKLISFNVGDSKIAQFVYQGDKTMSKLRRQRALSDAASTIELKLELAEELCVSDKMFSDWFDLLYTEDDSDDSSNATEVEDDIGDLQEDYCQRKILVEKKFIDDKVFNFTLNPSKIETANLDCNKHWFETSEEYGISLKDEFVSGLDDPSKKITRCIATTIRAGNYTEILLKVWMLSEIKISPEQKESERLGFVEFMKKLYTEIMKCQVTEEVKKTTDKV